MLKLLQENEVAPVNEPLTPLHRVTRQFDPPAVLLVSGQPAARMRGISATVGEELADPFDLTVGRPGAARLDDERRAGWGACLVHRRRENAPH